MTIAPNIALAQLNFTVGDIRGNADKIIAATQDAGTQGADLVVFPEMAITGYPAEDLLFKGEFQRASMQAAHEIAKALADCSAAALVGGFWVQDGIRYNSAFLIEGGEILHRHDKHWLPNYGVFDEKRVFTKGPYPKPFTWRGHALGILVCEDLWKPGLAKDLAAAGAELLISLNASPFEIGKDAKRDDVARIAAQASGVPVYYCNLVGGQDELVFDGRSFVMNAQGERVAQALGFEETILTTSPRGLTAGAMPPSLDPAVKPRDDELKEIYAAMTLGLRDYVHKNGFKGVVIGISGGIDSGLTATVAVDALGADKVHGLIMPSPYTSDESIEDAEALATHLQMQTHSINIEHGMQAFNDMLSGVFEGMAPDTTEENIQARIRGNLLMAYSNKHGFMVLTTGNKSEMSVGYATLYGDMCGGYSVLKDVYKTTVFALSRWRNRDGEVIPDRMITKPPTAELKPNQRDDDTLPPYETLDVILHALIEERLGVEEVIALGHDADTVKRIAKLLYVAEYKRRQSPPGVKITGMAFGRDRRYPITSKWVWQR
jgi:NAD+ synthase